MSAAGTSTRVLPMTQRSVAVRPGPQGQEDK